MYEPFYFSFAKMVKNLKLLVLMIVVQRLPACAKQKCAKTNQRATRPDLSLVWLKKDVAALHTSASAIVTVVQHATYLLVRTVKLL